MIRINKAALITGLIIMGVTFVEANSGPTYWSGHPSMESLAVESNSPIKVQNEELSFDFSKEFIDKGHNSISGLVTADYEMYNPTDESLNVQLAFPFAADLWSFDPSEIMILAEGVKVPYQVYIGEKFVPKDKNKPEEYKQNLTFESIVGYVGRYKYDPKLYGMEDIGTLYKLKVESLEGEIRIALDYKSDFARTKVIGRGFNGYEGNEDNVRISAWIRDKGELEFFVVGDDIEFSLHGYKDGEMKTEIDSFTYNIKTEQMSVEKYLENEIEEYFKDLPSLESVAENQIFNMCAKTLDRMFADYQGFYWIDDWLSAASEKLILILLYDLDFEPRSSINTSVSYYAVGTMDRTETVDPLYTFDYLLNPANNWASFGDISISIKPPADQPFIIESSIELVRNEEGFYTTYLEGLPDEDLSFTLYSNEKITYMDKIEKQLNSSMYFLPIFIPLMIAVFIFGIWLIVKRRKTI